MSAYMVDDESTESEATVGVLKRDLPVHRVPKCSHWKISMRHRQVLVSGLTETAHEETLSGGAALRMRVVLLFSSSLVVLSIIVVHVWTTS